VCFGCGTGAFPPLYAAVIALTISSTPAWIIDRMRGIGGKTNTLISSTPFYLWAKFIYTNTTLLTACFAKVSVKKVSPEEW